MKTNDGYSRRKFLSTGVLALSGLTAFGYSGLPSLSLSSDKVRVGIIGSGSRGLGLVHLLKDLPGVELVACCDIIEKNLQDGMRLASKGAKSYLDYRKLLADKNIDAVIIATPLYLHFQMGMDAIDAGKHVYLEKTMAYDIPQTLELVRKANNAPKLAFQIGHQYRYFPLYHKVAEVLSKGWIGQVVQFETQYNRNSDWRKPVEDPKMEEQINWRMYKKYSGGLLAELAAHQIDIVNWMVGGPPLKAIGFGGIDYWKDGRDTNDNVEMIYEYKNGIKSIVTSRLMNAFDGYLIRIVGTKGTIEIHRDDAFLFAESVDKVLGVVDGVSGATIQNSTQGKAIPLEFSYPNNKEMDPTAYALLDFAECVRTGKKPACNVETGKEAAIAVHMGNQSIDSGKVQLWLPSYSI